MALGAWAFPCKQGALTVPESTATVGTRPLACILMHVYT